VAQIFLLHTTQNGLVLEQQVVLLKIAVLELLFALQEPQILAQGLHARNRLDNLEDEKCRYGLLKHQPKYSHLAAEDSSPPFSCN
jgi:hypothetical protein